MKRVLLGLFTLVMILGLVACNESPHVHQYSEAWTFDDDYHWHKATCGHTGEVSGKEAHTFDKGETTKETTTEEEGEKTYTCTECGYKKTEPIEKLHEHTYDDSSWASDDDYHWHKATCGHETVKDKSQHVFSEWTTIKDATETGDGEKKKTCTVCDYEVKETIARLGHTHTFSSDWSKDEKNHWHAATCGHTNEVSDKAEHTFGEWTTDEEATENKEGKKHRICSVCSYIENGTIDIVGHECTASKNYDHDDENHWFKCTNELCTKHVGEEKHTLEWKNADGGKHYQVCKCGYETSKGDHTLTYVDSKDGKTHYQKCNTCGYTTTPVDHSLGWKSTDDGKHYQECKCCGYKTEEVNHSFVAGTVIKEATCTEDGEQTYNCVCGETKTEKIQAKGHTYSEEWTTDETYHWHEATCGHPDEVSEKVEHTFGDITIENNRQKQSCTVCSCKAPEYINVNLLSNAGLEKDFESYGQSGFEVVTDTGKVRSGSKAIYSAKNNSERYIYQAGITSVQKDKDGTMRVKASVWMKLEDVNDINSINLVLERVVNSETKFVQIHPQATTEWQQVVLRYETKEEVTSFCVKVVLSGNSDVDGVYLDDFELVAENCNVDYIRNGSFEVDTAWGDYGTYKAGSKGINSTVAMSLSSEKGDKEKDICTATGWFGESSPKYDGTTTTKFSVWIKNSGNATGNIQLGYEAKFSDSSVDSKYTDFKVGEGETKNYSDWTQISIPVPEIAEGKTLSEMLLHIKTGSGFKGVVYFDNASWTLSE